MNITIDIPDMATIVLPAALYRAEIERERSTATHALQQELDALKAERREMVDALNLGEGDNPAVAVGAIITERDNARAEIAELERSNTAQANTIKELAAKLEALEEPPVKPDDTVPIVLPTDPVIKPPVPELPHVPTVPNPPEPVEPLPAPTVVKLPAPTFTPDKVDNLFGIFISDGMASGARRDTWLRDVINFIAEARVFNAVFMFANLFELRTWEKNPISNPVRWLHDHNIAWFYDTWNSIDSSTYPEVAGRVKAFGATGVEIDDAHRWLPVGQENGDQLRMDQMRGMVSGASRVNLPLIASYGGKTDIKPHSSMKLYIARQAYVNGENPRLVKSYLTPDTHIANLGAYRPDKDSPMTTPAEVRGAFDAFRDSPVKGLAWYGFDDGTDLRKFPAQWAEIVSAGRTYWKERGVNV